MVVSCPEQLGLPLEVVKQRMLSCLAEALVTEHSDLTSGDVDLGKGARSCACQPVATVYTDACLCLFFDKRSTWRLVAAISQGKFVERTCTE